MKRVRALLVVAAVVASAVGLVPSAFATSASTTLNLNGGDQLQANAWHCGTYATACSFANSAQVLGYNPAFATWVKNQTIVESHGYDVDSISLSNPIDIHLTAKTSTLINSTWENYPAWISSSSGTVHVGWCCTTYVSSQENASAYYHTFGTPHDSAYAGAL